VPRDVSRPVSFRPRHGGGVTVTEDETREARLQARRSVSAAGAELADAYDATAGALVTGYVAVFELTTAEGRFCVWLTGTGAEPDEASEEGLDSWRVEGLVRQVLRDLNAENVSDE
jgi:hypothetical protein